MPDPHCSTIGQGDADPHMFHGRRGRSTRRRSVLAAVALSCLAVLAATPASAASSDPVVTVEETVTTPAPGTTVTTTRTSTSTPAPATVADTSTCTEAAGLTEDLRPEDAIALIDAEREARGKDGSQLCAAERTAALLEEARGPAGPSGDVGRGWARIQNDLIEPLLPSVLTALGWLLLTFLVSIRALSLLPVRPPRIRSARYRAALAGGSIGLALLAIVAGLLEIREVGGSEDGDGSDARAIGVAAVLLLCTAAVLAALWVAGRMSISVEARSGDDVGRTTQLIALLRRVGGSPPSGVEIPRGSDVTSLAESTLLPTPANSVAKAALGLVLALVGSTPWRVSLDYLDDDTAAVVISRNGRTVETALLTTSAGSTAGPLLGDDAEEAKRSMLCALAAGVVIVALSRAHPGFEGLNGATDGRSVGLHYVATTVFAEDHDTAVLLLGRALHLDPGNLSAGVALQNLLHRHATDPGELRTYRDTLAAEADLLIDSGHTLLAQRVLITYFAVLVNLHAADRTAHRPSTLDERYAQMTRLLDATEKQDRLTEQDPLLLASRARFEILRMAVDGEYREPEPVRSAGGADEDTGGCAAPSRLGDPAHDPQGAYNAALLALQNGDDRLASFRIGPAMTSRELRRWMRRDPDVVRFRDRERVARMVGGGSSERLWDLTPFAPHRALCARNGLTTPLALAHVDSAAAADLGVTTTALTALVSAAELASRVWSVTPPVLPEGPDLGQWRVDLTEILLETAGPVSAPAAAVELAKRMPPLAPATAAGLGAVVAEWLASLEPEVEKPPEPERMRGLPLALSIDLHRR